jgi:hypothetical protein
MTIVALLKNDGQGFKMFPESLQRRWRTLKRQTGGNVMLVPIDHFDGQRLLALEVIVEGTLKNPGGARYVLDGCSLVSLGEETLKGRIEEFVADVGLAHPGLISEMAFPLSM